MDSRDWEALLERAAAVVSDVQGAFGADGGANVEWFHPAGRATASPYRVDQTVKAIGLNRDIVEGWLRELPGRQADERFIALALRSAAALFFGPPAYRWKEAAELRIRSEQEQGLDESFAWAFAAASQILENHRLDQRILELIPDAGIRLAQLVQFDLEAHPAFDIYPRAAIVMGRPNLPSDFAQPAFDAFVDTFGVDEADELASILNKYVSFKPDAIDEMVDATARLVFQAFPEAMGLWRGGGDQSEDLTSEDLWPFQGKLPEDGAIGWDDLERFVALTLPRFTGAAGLDFGDVLLIGLDGEAVAGRRIGAWSRSGAIYLDLTQTDFASDAVRELLARGWEQFGNAPESLFKFARAGEADQVAAEIIWILRDLAALPSTGGLTLWGRGPAGMAAEELGWEL